ncbi:MAG TPA: hypothetical protein PKN95_12560 [Verrucomicrobiota bacterium]|nr:hypothetical protein [Verrucomicrobiota bacterium]HNT15850.1 hypothetical protein [Verrucomicrobiota bacterium]
MMFLRYFFYVVLGALFSAVLGGLFAAMVAFISPDFVRELFSPTETANLTRYAMAGGMIWGIFLGTAVTAFSLFLVTVLQVARLWKRRLDGRS